jgi:hypothetical protein
MALIFPKWTNEIPRVAPPVLTVLGAFAIFVVWYWWSPKHTDVGYAPVQPIAYSHKLHAGDLGMDCRYCHANVERSPHAGVPPTQTCMNCHRVVKSDSPALTRLRESWKDGEDGGPVHWKRIHKVPDYAYFDHSAHVNVGVGCKECHGRIDQMVVVRQAEPLSMGWCLDCHRNPAPHLRPLDKITDMTWTPDDAWTHTAVERAAKLKPPTVACSGCHR